MNNSSKATKQIVYEDFEPTYNWVREEESDTLVLLLSGFRKEEMKVQITSNNILKVSGEEKMKDNKTSVRRRFYREFSVPKGANINRIIAQFEDGKLYIKLPKTIMTKKKPETHKEEEDVSKANKQASQKKQEEDEAINNKKQTWKLMIGFIVALLMLVFGNLDRV